MLDAFYFVRSDFRRNVLKNTNLYASLVKYYELTIRVPFVSRKSSFNFNNLFHVAFAFAWFHKSFGQIACQIESKAIKSICSHIHLNVFHQSVITAPWRCKYDWHLVRTIKTFTLISDTILFSVNIVNFRRVIEFTLYVDGYFN